MCCVGCAAVAEMLAGQGLANWYVQRASPTGAPPAVFTDESVLLDLLGDSALESEFAAENRDGLMEAGLLVDGMTCAACVWVVERHLERLAGVVSVRVNLVSRRAQLVWDPEVCDLRAIAKRLAEIGFAARPDRPNAAADMEKAERKRALIRLGISGLGTMNVMTYAVGLYLGVVDGMDASVRDFLRWMCLLVTTPVVFIGARPFFSGALRDLRARRVGMDVPVALAIGGAHIVSGWAVVRGSGEVYFESACMFTFFLGLGRFVEMNVRHRASAAFRSHLDHLPDFARVVAKRDSAEPGEAETERLIPAASLSVGDVFSVRPGERIAADGIVKAGTGQVEEALLTGEPWPRKVAPGTAVIAGSMNSGSPLRVEATRVGGETALSGVMGLIERAQSEKPAVAGWADRVAGVFVACVLIAAAGTAIVWLQIDPSRAIWVTLAVLVATCPCALGLATPAAVAAATQSLAASGLLVTRGHVLEGLAGARRVVFDKTGTLTEGTPSLVRSVILRPGCTEASVLTLARQLEQDSEHPLGRAFGAGAELDASGVDAAIPSLAPVASSLRTIPGAGVEGEIDGLVYRLGRPDWAWPGQGAEGGPGLAKAGGRSEPAALPAPGGGPAANGPAGQEARSWVLLADGAGPIAWFGLADRLRSEAATATRQLADLGLALEMLSGDPSPGSADVAEQLGLDVAVPAATPEEKLRRIGEIQEMGEGTLAVGDGLNDGPLMRAAGVSVAMGSGCDLTRVSADALLLNNDLGLLPRAVECARKTQRVIRQNFAWAIGYNLCVLPLAATGHLAPWLAAIGMSASSLVVVLNANRLSRLA